MSVYVSAVACFDTDLIIFLKSLSAWHGMTVQTSHSMFMLTIKGQSPRHDKLHAIRSLVYVIEETRVEMSHFSVHNGNDN